MPPTYSLKNIIIALRILGLFLIEAIAAEIESRLSLVSSVRLLLSILLIISISSPNVLTSRIKFINLIRSSGETIILAITSGSSIAAYLNSSIVKLSISSSNCLAFKL